MSPAGAASPRRTVRPGSWYAVLGDHATVLLPPTEKERVATLWSLVDDGAAFDEVLDELISGGLRRLPGFVLVSDVPADAGGATQVVVRGPARVELVVDGERVQVEGTQATTWVERTVTGVRGLEVRAEDPPPGEPFTVATGLLRASVVHMGEAGGQTAPVDVPGQRERENDRDPGTDHEPETDHDGDTRAGEIDPALLRSAPPGIPGQPPAPPVVSRPVARLVLSSGETVEVDRAVVVGRAPEAHRHPGPEQPRLVTVPSPHQEISSTHVEFRPGTGADHGSAVVTDLGSTNGTVLVQPGLPPEDLRAGVSVQALPGAIVDLGDGVTVQVLRP